MPIIYVPGNYDSRISKTTNGDRVSFSSSVVRSRRKLLTSTGRLSSSAEETRVIVAARNVLGKSNFHSDFNGAALLSIGICFDSPGIEDKCWVAVV